MFVVLSNVLRVRRDITDFQRVDAVLSSTVRAVPFCRTLSDGRVSTRSFFRLLPSSPAGSCPCKLRPFSILCVPDSPPCRQWISAPCAGNAPFHRIGTKNRCLKRSSSGYGSAGVLTFRQATRVGFSVRDGGDVRHPHDGDDVRGVLRNPRAFR